MVGQHMALVVGHMVERRMALVEACMVGLHMA